MDTSESALSIFKNGFNCAQAVLAASVEKTDLPDQVAYRIACGFGAGMGRRQKTCGAVSGGIMVIGMLYGRDGSRTDEAKEKTYSVVNAFMDEFEKRHSTTECRELLGCDLNTEEGKRKYIDSRLYSTVCLECIRDVTAILEEVCPGKSDKDPHG
jgi:C_GCAxxG_C_C family probable redox protein